MPQTLAPKLNHVQKLEPKTVIVLNKIKQSQKLSKNLPRQKNSLLQEPSN